MHSFIMYKCNAKLPWQFLCWGNTAANEILIKAQLSLIESCHDINVLVKMIVFKCWTLAQISPPSSRPLWTFWTSNPAYPKLVSNLVQFQHNPTQWMHHFLFSFANQKLGVILDPPISHHIQPPIFPILFKSLSNVGISFHYHSREPSYKPKLQIAHTDYC